MLAQVRSSGCDDLKQPDSASNDKTPAVSTPVVILCSTLFEIKLFIHLLQLNPLLGPQVWLEPIPVVMGQRRGTPCTLCWSVAKCRAITIHTQT